MRPVPTRRLAVVMGLTSLLLVVLPGKAVLAPVLLVDLLLVVVALLDAWTAVDPQRLQLTRAVPAVLTTGSTGEVRWTIRNPTSSRLRVTFADELAPSLRAGDRRSGGVVPAGATLIASTTITPSRRGRFEIDELVVRVEGVLGLGARQRTILVPATLRVHPPFVSSAEADLRLDRARVVEVGLRSARGRGGGTEFDQLREYAVDDEVRRIDWAATARAGKAMVRTYRAERNQTVVLLLDNGRVMAGQVAGAPRVEQAMDAVQCLTTVATRLGDRCGLVLFDNKVRTVIPARSGRDQLGRVTEAMYDLEPALAESDYRTAFAETMGRFRRRSLIVLFTDLVEQAVGESLLPALPLLVRHHVVVVAAVRDPEVDEWAAREPEESSQAYRMVAARGSLAERERAIARLRGLGAIVIDAPAGRLAANVADAYLDLKARGSL